MGEREVSRKREEAGRERGKWVGREGEVGRE